MFDVLYYRCDVARSTLIDSIVNKYKEAIDEYRNLIEGDEEPDEDEIFNVVQSLKKVSIFYSCHNMNPWGIWDSLYKDIEDAKDPSKYEYSVYYTQRFCLRVRVFYRMTFIPDACRTRQLSIA